MLKALVYFICNYRTAALLQSVWEAVMGMPGEKYVVAAADNALQIAVRNVLNPRGYLFLGNCNDAVSLLRLIRSYDPDFIVADMNMPLRDLRITLETIDDEMLCACVIIGEYKDEIVNFIENSKTLFLCPKPLDNNMLIHTIELANINFRRIKGLSKKLQEVTENLETRKLVDRAKWILIEMHGISENEAYERMRKKSMDSRLTMKAIAEAIIFTHDITKK